MESHLLHSLVADCAVTIAFWALMMSLASVSRHPALRGAVFFAMGQIGFTAGSSLFILLLDAGVPASQRPWIAGSALLVSTTGCAAMVDGIARLLEDPRRPRLAVAAWGLSLMLMLWALLPWQNVDSLKVASDVTNTLGMLGLAIVLLRRQQPPYRVPTLAAGACTALLLPLYFIGSLQQWTGIGPTLVPHYSDWVWLDLALWNTVNFCVLMLASFKAITVFAQRSRLDSLTGVLNRDGLANEREALALRHPRGVHLSVLAIDIDHFKRINDEHGHAAGDAYLAAFVGTLREHLRSTDLLARWGGEEFIALLVGAPIDAGQRVAEDLRAGVEDLVVMFDNRMIRTTTSIGIAEGTSGDAFDSLVARADAALYSAKREGRNRVNR